MILTDLSNTINKIVGENFVSYINTLKYTSCLGGEYCPQLELTRELPTRLCFYSAGSLHWNLTYLFCLSWRHSLVFLLFYH